jgi:L-cysteine:1D-myo-inositol 2-amino-2-deoxy-alpha-D-glucopyranoside ligase
VEAWRAPIIPQIPGHGPDLRLYDAASREVRATTPGRTARMYVCGITPYDATHMGHAATYLTFDLVGRYWRDRGHDVHYVQNVTDIDDPLLERAVQTGDDWREIARRETQLFREDMEALGVVPPQDYIGAVESIPSVVRCIQGLSERGAVYDVEGDLYFDVASDDLFGEVSHATQDQMRELFGECGGDPLRPGKRHPLDPLLWRAARPEEPAWDTPLGHGRPGWHIECVAIALDHLGMSFDVQGGGRDLLFPHHEMGASHAEVLTGQWPFARHYVHAGLVGLEGHKMSKSLGNLVFVHRLRQQGVSPSAVRLAVAAHHYRGDWEWTEEGLDAAIARQGRWSRAARLGSGPAPEPVIEALRTALADDLDTPRALAILDRWADEALERGGAYADGPRQVAEAVDALLGVRLLD